MYGSSKEAKARITKTLNSLQNFEIIIKIIYYNLIFYNKILKFLIYLTL